MEPLHLVLLWSVVQMTLTLESPINGPEPMAAVAPVGAMVTFTCVVNTTELKPDVFHSISWRENGKTLSGNFDQENSNQLLDLVTSTLQLPVLQDYTTGVLVQCQVFVNVLVSDTVIVLKSNNATLAAYGPPEAPSNLTSTQSSSNALILSWSAPSSPVQLHYTVTVNTSTTITVTNDTAITITREEVMTAINSTECDLYTFNIIAANLGGSSIPANLTTPFVPAPRVSVSVATSSNGSALDIIVVQFATDASTAFVELVDSYGNKSYSKVWLFIGNKSWSFNITDPQNWTNITVIVQNKCRNVSVPVNITELVYPNTDPVTTTTTPTAHTMTATSLLPSSTDTTMTTSLPVWVTALVVVLALVVSIALAGTITITGGFCIRRMRRSTVLPKYFDEQKRDGLELDNVKQQRDTTPNSGSAQGGCSSYYEFFYKKKNNQSNSCSESSVVKLEGAMSSDEYPNKKTDLHTGRVVSNNASPSRCMIQ